MKMRLLAMAFCLGMAFGNASAIYADVEAVLPAEADEFLVGVEDNVQNDSLIDSNGDEGVVVFEENDAVEGSDEIIIEPSSELTSELSQNITEKFSSSDSNTTIIDADSLFDTEQVEDSFEESTMPEDEEQTEEPEEEAEDAETEEELEQTSLPSVMYRTHVQKDGWQNFVQDGVMSGTQGQSKRLEGIEIKVTGADLGIRYKTHIQTYGWETNWRENGKMSGTQGQAKRLEAIRIELTGTDAAKYDVWYCVHAQHFGWLGWAKNGADAGTAGYAYRLEGIKIKILPKDSAAPKNEGTSSSAFFSKSDGPSINTSISGVAYNTHVQTYGWQDYVYNGNMSGTSGQSKRLEGIHISLVNQKYSGNIEYRTHVQTYGWQDWKTNGAMSGTSGQGKRLEAIQIRLTGEIARYYDVYYRVHAQTYGWLAWASNGSMSGTSGFGKRLEGIQIVLVQKGEKSPSSDFMNIHQANNDAYVLKQTTDAKETVNLIKVDITENNFYDYFALSDKPVYTYDDFGELTDYMFYPYYSPVFDKGLVYWKGSLIIQYNSESYGILHTSVPYEGGCSDPSDPRQKIKKVKGTIYFVSVDDVASYNFIEPGKRNVVLVNGQSSTTEGEIPIGCYPQCPY